MASSVRRPLLAALLALGAAALGGCGAGPVHVVPPSPVGGAAGACRALHGALPGEVDGLARRATEPESAFTAAWGDPAVVLRCGVSRPDVLTPGHEHYNPLADAAEVNGVDWLLEKQADGYRFTTVRREANVEVTVPGEYAPEINALVDLADAVKKTIPTTL